MKRNVFINDATELQERLLDGRRVEGVLFVDGDTGLLTFKAYNRQSRKRPQDRLMRTLEHGWVKESKERIKIFESVPKALGTSRMLNVIDREVKESKNAIMTWDIIEFC